MTSVDTSSLMEVDASSRDKKRKHEDEKPTNGEKKHRSSHKSSSSDGSKDDKHRSRDKDKDKEREKDKERDKDKEREKDKERHKDKEREKDKERRKDKEKDKDKERDKDIERDKDKEKDKERHKDKERDKDKDRKKDSAHRDKDKESSSSRDKDKERDKDKSRDKDREHDKEKSRDKGEDKHKESKSKYTDKDKDRSRDEKERHKDKEKEKERSRDKDREREKGDKEREKDRDREREKDKDRSNRDKEKDRDREKDRRMDKERERERDTRPRGEREHTEKIDSAIYQERESEVRVKAEQEDAERDNAVFDENSGATEISLSVSATNALRAKLGLPPLIENEPSKEDAEKAQREREEAEKEAQAAELALKIEKMKNKRMLHAKMAGKGLADDGAEDALSWIKRSRKIEQERKAEQERAAAARNDKILQTTEREKALAAQRARMLDDFDDELDDEDLANGSTYTSRDLAGLKVAHDADVFGQGNTEILVLKDAPLIDGDDVNEDGDELENVGLAEQERRKKNKEAAKKKPLYDVYGDNQSETSQNILSQYDEEKEKEGLKITLDGSVNVEKQNQLEEIRKKLQAASKQAYDLGGEASFDAASKMQASDYYTQEEMAKFRRPATSRKKKLRKKEKVEPVATDENVIQDSGPSQDHGSRATREVKEDQEWAKDEERRRNYDKALEKAEATSKVMFSTVVDEEEEDFARTLSRAKKGATSSALPKLESVLAAVTTAQQKRQERQTPTSDDVVVFSATAEFVRNLNLEQQKDQDDYESERKALVAKNPPLAPKREGGFVETEVEPMVVDHGFAQVQIKKEEGPDDDDAYAYADDHEPSNAGIVEDEPLVAGGMAATLKLLAQKGGVRAVDSFVGRANDKRTPTGTEGPRDILLERLDARGRPVTLKEAFRLHSYAFHGKQPGKNNVERRNRQYEEQKRMQAASSSDTPLMTLQAMQNAQAKAGTPYIVLSSSSIARGLSQPSTATPDAPTPTPSSTAAAKEKKRKGAK